jgi:steroid delta-isomerase-like uncharacterized protein
MTPPRFGDPAFLREWGTRWSCGDPDELLPLYAPDARYADVASGTTYVGHDQIARFYRFMLQFAPDSKIEFDTEHGDRTGFAAHWIWSGTATGPLRLGEDLFPAAGVPFSVPGIGYCTLDAHGLIASHEDYYDMFAIVRAIQRGANRS